MAIKFLSGQTIDGTLTVSGNVQGATFNGLAINTTGVNNVANQIVRTQANGYAKFGWINSVSGNHTGAITRITASNDQYLRYVTPAQFRTGVTDGYYAPVSTVSGVTSVATTNGITGGTIISTGTIQVDSTVVRTTGDQSITGNKQFYPSSTGTGYSTAAIELMASSSGLTGTPPRIGFHWGGVVASSIAIESNGTIVIRDNPGTGYEDFKALNITATGVVYASGGNSGTWNSHTSNTGTVTSVATGAGLTGGTITTTGTLSLDRPNSQLGAVLATYGTTAGASGRVRCTAPFNTNSGKMFSIEITLYGSYTQHNYVVSAYMYSTTNQWYSPKAIYTTTGSATPDIYVGRDANGKAYISIANANYAGVLVHNMTRGYYTSTPDTYDPWTISITGGNENSVAVSTSQIWTTANHTPGNYLPLSGGTMTGSINMGSNNITSIGSGLSLSGYDLTSTVGLNLKVDSGSVSAITIDNVGSTTFSGYTYFPNYLFHAGDTNTRIGFTTGVVTIRGDSGITLDGPTTTNANFIGTTATFSGLTNLLGGSKIVVQNSVNGGTSRGIFMWNNTDANWGIYMATPGSTQNIAGGAAPSGLNGESSHSIRFRIASNAANGFIWENSSNATLMSMNGNSGNLTTSASMRSPIFYDSANTAYYGDFASTSNMFQGYYKGKTAGWSLQLGDANIARVFNDSARASLVINSAYYPHLYINANTDSSNLNHGAVFSMSGNIVGGGFRRWSMGIPNSNPNMLTIGTADNNTNPHYGCGGDVLGEATWGSKFWLDSSSNLQTNGSMRSPIFYDSNDTNYYVNPNAQSRIRDLATGDQGILASGYPLTAYDSQRYLIGFRNSATGANYPWLVHDTYDAVSALQFHFNAAGDRFQFTESGNGYAYTSFRAPIFYDSNNTAYYGHFDSYSSMRGVAIRGDLGASDVDNQIFFYGTGGSTTSAIGFKNGGQFANPTGQGDGWNTHFTMDTANRGWVFRRGTGGANFTSAFTSGWILNTGEWQANTSMKAPIFYDSTNTAFYLDPASTGTSLNVAGDVVAYASSDIRFKNNITPITNALDKINKIGGYTFEWNEKSHKETGKKDIGVIAQEVEEILPEIVDTRDNGYKAVDYSKLTALLIQSVKEQQVIIDSLKSRIETLENN